MTNSSKSTQVVDRRGSGRPTVDEGRDVRGQLLLAARDLFTQHGFEGTSTRQIAAAVGATPAMIHYYFGDKHGLYQALLEEIIRPVLEGLEQRAGTAGGSATVRDFLSAYLGMFGDHPWLPVLVFREMHEGGEEFRSHFAQQFGSRLKELLTNALAEERAAGRVRDDVDPDLAIVSLLSLCVFPFLARPMLERVLRQTVDGQFIQRWQTHVSRMLNEGLAP